jgi:hypothetical protein
MLTSGLTCVYIYMYLAHKGVVCCRVWWLTPVILVTWEVEIGGSEFKDSLGKKLLRPYLK